MPSTIRTTGLETAPKTSTKKKSRPTSMKKRNTDLAFLIGGNDGQMDEETRAWYDVHRQDILRPPSTALSSPSTSTPAASTPAIDDGIALAVGVKEDKGWVGCRVGTKGASPNP
jgi:hypothetical protein